MKNHENPIRIFWPKDVGKSKLKYLAHGFMLLGVPIAPSATLRKESIDSQLYPLVFEYEGGQRIRVWFDIVASRYKKHLEVLEGDENAFYFKTHMAKSDLKTNPRFMPMPQAVSNMQYLTKYQELRKERINRKKFNYDVMALFVNSDSGLREKTVEKLRAMTDLRILAWMIQHPKLERPAVAEELTGEKLRYSQHLKIQAATKICLALPGAWKNGGASISFRHSEVWGIGGVVASIRPGTLMVGKPNKCWLEFRQDLSNFEEVIRGALENEKQLKRLSRAGARYWDAVHHPKKAADYMMRQISKFK